MKKYDPLPFSTFTVPFDFDGSKFVWLEYKENSVKEMVIFDLFENKPVYFKKFDKNTEFISYCKIFHQWLVYVEENKKVFFTNYLSSETKLLYSHKAPITALGIFSPEEFDNGSNFPADKNNEVIILQIDEKEPKKNMKEKNPLVENDYSKLKNLTIFSIDYNGNFMAFKNGLIIHNFNVLRLHFI